MCLWGQILELNQFLEAYEARDLTVCPIGLVIRMRFELDISSLRG